MPIIFLYILIIKWAAAAGHLQAKWINYKKPINNLISPQDRSIYPCSPNIEKKVKYDTYIRQFPIPQEGVLVSHRGILVGYSMKIISQTYNNERLALLYKTLKNYSSAIRTINKMLLVTSNNQPQIMKGKIIRCWCQIEAVKNYCEGYYGKETGDKGDHINEKEQQEAIDKIKEAINTLQGLLDEQESREIAEEMHLYQYLKNGRQVEAALKLKILSQQDRQLVKYLESRLRQKDAKNSSFQKIKGNFPTPQLLVGFIKDRMLKAKQTFDLDYQNEDFVADPITYELFSSPIIVKSGLTYEQSSLKEHLSVNGSVDPITRQNICDGQGRFGVKNHTLQRYIQEASRVHKIQLKDLCFEVQ